MNLRLIYLYHNLSRNKLRTALTAAAVALPLMIYVLSTAVVRGIEAYLDNSVKQLRLAVQHKGSLISTCRPDTARGFAPWIPREIAC